MPKVSIIVAVYNIEEYLQRSMDCLVNQTLKDIEIICIDDCSTDDSLMMLKAYAKNDNRIKVITLDENMGAAFARNQGLKIAAGEYIGFIDPDDAIDLNYYEELYNKAKEQDYDIVKCARKTINLDGTVVLSKKNEHIRKHGILAFTFEWTTAIYKADMVRSNNIFLPNECRKAQDIVFLNRCILCTKSLAVIDNVYYYYYRRKNSLNHSTIPLQSVESALLAIRLILKDMNDSDLYKKDCEIYTRFYYNRLDVHFYTMFQSSSFYGRYLCVKSLITSYHKCLNVEGLRKIFAYKWMLPYIEKRKVFLLTLKLKNFKRGQNLKYRKNTFFENIFSMRNIGKHKVCTFLGVKLKIKNPKFK